MESIYIYGHLGVGDHLLTNGLVNHYCETNDRVYLFAKPHNSAFVKRLYNGNSKIRVISLDDIGVRQFMQFAPDNNYLIVGHTTEYFKRVNNFEFTFDEGFYVMAGLPVHFKWGKFQHIVDKDQRNKVMMDLNYLSLEDYIFVHDDPARGRVFKEKYLPKGIRRFRPIEHPEVSILDMVGIIQCAKEVHVHNSSFSCFIDLIKMQHPALFYHKYARTDAGDFLFSNQVKWNFYE